MHRRNNLHSILLLLLIPSTLAAAAADYKNSNPGITYTVINRASNSKPPGCSTVFTTHIGIPAAKQAMSSATNFVLTLFNESRPTDRKNTKNEIHVNANFLGSYKGNIRREFVGIVYHQVASIWQWNGGGEAPKGLVSGIAEFVRMNARYGTSEKVRGGDGNRWDEGDGVTCRFLEYCEEVKKGFVMELNRKMRYGYTNAYFVDLLGKSVDQVWKDYKAKYPPKH
ncbi:hypothetical protein LINPERPRIM_LOCUS26438 [Linum perenne]